MSFRDFLDSLVRIVPNKQDTKYSKIVKAASAVDLVVQQYDDYKLKNIYKQYKESFNEILYCCLSDDSVKKEVSSIKLKDYDYDTSYLHFTEIIGVGKYLFKTKSKLAERDKHYGYYHSVDMNFRALGDLIYKKYGNKIFIDTRSSTRRKLDYDEYFLEPVKGDDHIIEFDAHKQAVNLLKDKGVYLFYGKPGTGKSSFIFSENFKNKKCLIMLASLFCDLKQIEVDSLLNIFNPDLLLIEEFDKASARLDSVLLFFERVRNKNTTIVLTANKIDSFDPAVIRPKRIDKIVKFDVPKRNEIELLVNYYSKANEEDKLKFINLIEKSKFSHAYVVDLAKKLNDNFQEIETYVNFIRSISKNDK